MFRTLWLIKEQDAAQRGQIEGFLFSDVFEFVFSFFLFFQIFLKVLFSLGGGSLQEWRVDI